MGSITVRKLNPAGQETWRYTGRVLERHAGRIVLEAEFNRDDTPFHEIMLRSGDRFVETFYTDRWYNVFEIHDRDDHRLKGWYCNIGQPAVIEEETVAYIDLALSVIGVCIFVVIFAGLIAFAVSSAEWSSTYIRIIP